MESGISTSSSLPPQPGEDGTAESVAIAERPSHAEQNIVDRTSLQSTEEELKLATTIDEFYRIELKTHEALLSLKNDRIRRLEIQVTRLEEEVKDLRAKYARFRDLAINSLCGIINSFH